MIARIVASLLSKVGFGFLDRILGHLEKKATSEVERLKVHAAREAKANAEYAGIVKEGMKYKVFWIPWLIAAVPLTLWFAWGVLDSLFNGGLPDVATLPPQLKAYADIVFANIFYAGGGMAGIQTIASAISRRK